MLEETARIKRISGQHAWVETRAQVSCERCASGRGCGAGTLAQAFGNSSRPEVRVRLDSTLPLTVTKQPPTQPPVAGGSQLTDNIQLGDIQPGDAVIVGIDERAIVSGSLVLYGLPLLAMVVFATAAATLNNSDGLTAMAGAAGLLSGIAASRSIAQRLGQQPRFEPKVLRRLSPGSWESSCSTDSNDKDQSKNGGLRA